MTLSLDFAGARLIPVMNDYNEPALSAGTHCVVAHPCDGYRGEGFYVMEHDNVRLCDVGAGGLIRAYGVNKKYTVHTFTKDEFARQVTGRVVAEIKVSDSTLQARLYMAMAEQRRSRSDAPRALEAA
jgi:hypothetical protein